MHELPVTERILDIALAHGRENDVSKIVSITLRVGGLTDLQDSWLQHYFDYLSKGTMAEGATLKIIREGVRLRCSECKTMIETDKDKLADETCPHCGAIEGFSIISGREYFIEEMEAQ